MNKPLFLRMEDKIDRAAETGCWLWTGACVNGYGKIRVGNKIRTAHKVIYEIAVGEVPEHLELDHLCRVRHCVNPFHLEPVSRRENVLRGIGLAALNAKVLVCPAGHEYTEANTYRYGRRRYCRLCRKRS